MHLIIVQQDHEFSQAISSVVMKTVKINKN